MRKKLRIAAVAGGLTLLGAVGVACQEHDTLYHCGLIDQDQTFAHVYRASRTGDTDFCYMAWDSTGAHAATCHMNIHDESYGCRWA